MRYKALALCVVLVASAVAAAQGARSETPGSPVSEERETYRFSVGVNDLPWDATGIAFRWWKNAQSGREFVLSDISGGYEDMTYQGDKASGYSFSIGSVRYGFLHRRPSGVLEGLYVTGGVEFGMGAQVSVYRMPSGYPNVPDQERRYYSVSGSCYFPLGVEHFFVDRFPNVSYSIEANMNVTLKYTRDADYYPGHDRIANAGTVGFGIRPLFFFRCYF
jgi:hypothetical protein